MKAKATHKGTCQYCDKIHKLPDGKLAAHGYTVDYGFFSGICPGSFHLPLELDCSQLNSLLQRLEYEVQRLQENMTQLEHPDNSAGVMAKIKIHKKGVYGKKSQKIETTVLITERQDENENKIVMLSYTDPFTEKKIYLSAHEAGYPGYSSAEEFQKALHQQKIDLLNQQLRRTQNYLQKRHTEMLNWEPKPLLPL